MKYIQYNLPDNKPKFWSEQVSCCFTCFSDSFKLDLWGTDVGVWLVSGETLLEEKNLTGCGWDSLDFNRPIVQLDGMFLECTNCQRETNVQPTRIKSNPWNGGVKAVDTNHQRPLSKKAGPDGQTEDCHPSNNVPIQAKLDTSWQSDDWMEESSRGGF